MLRGQGSNLRNAHACLRLTVGPVTNSGHRGAKCTCLWCSRTASNRLLIHTKDAYHQGILREHIVGAPRRIRTHIPSVWSRRSCQLEYERRIVVRGGPGQTRTGNTLLFRQVLYAIGATDPLFLVATVGIEPTTFALSRRYSTTELRGYGPSWRNRTSVIALRRRNTDSIGREMTCEVLG